MAGWGSSDSGGLSLPLSLPKPQPLTWWPPLLCASRWDVHLRTRLLALTPCWSSPLGVHRFLKVNSELWQWPLPSPPASPSPSEISAKQKSGTSYSLLNFPVSFSSSASIIPNSWDTQLPPSTHLTVSVLHGVFRQRFSLCLKTFAVSFTLVPNPWEINWSVTFFRHLFRDHLPMLGPQMRVTVPFICSYNTPGLSPCYSEHFGCKQQKPSLKQLRQKGNLLAQEGQRFIWVPGKLNAEVRDWGKVPDTKLHPIQVLFSYLFI